MKLAVIDEYKKIVNRFNDVMCDIGCEHLMIGSSADLEGNPVYYGIETGVTIGWMIEETGYWYSCYYEVGNVRHDDKADDYATWRSESGKLERLHHALKKFDPAVMVAHWA